MTILQQLCSLANISLAQHHQRFFKTGKGQYGEGDVFLGIKVPVIRDTVKKAGSITLAEVSELLGSPYHEVRFYRVYVSGTGLYKGKDRRNKTGYL